MTSNYFNLVIALGLVFLNGFFVASEFALVKVRSTRIDQLLEEGNPRAKMTRKVISDLDAYLSATQLGITLTSLGLGWLGESAIAHLLEPLLPGPLNHVVAGIIAFAVITFLHIVLGELAPKSLAIQRTEQVALATAAPLHLFHTLFYPFIYVLNASALGILRLLGIKPASEKDLSHSEEELRMLVMASAQSGHLDETERSLLDNVFDFSERVAREVMVPRGEMVCLYLDDSLEENIRVARTEGHTRFPLCEGDKDHVIGLVHIKDLLRLGIDDKPVLDLRQIMRPILAVPETNSISTLLKEMQRRRTHMAVLVDEYGGTAGMVTLENLLEEIVGDIRDEFDDEPPEVEAVAPNVYEVDGALLLEEVEERFGLNLPEEHTEEVDTIGGYIFSLLGRQPVVGDQVPFDQMQAQVAEVDGFRIVRVRLSPLEQSVLAEPDQRPAAV